MSPSLMQPNLAKLRWGLHALVLALATVVLIRAIALGEPRTGLIAVMVTLFAAAYLARLRTSRAWTRGLLLAGMVGTWASLTLLGADAAYLSVALFLIFLTDLRLHAALASVAAVTLFAVGAAAAQSDSVALLAAPILGAVVTVLFGLGYRTLFDSLARQQELIDALGQTRSELARTERAAGQAVERQRLARDIHDTVAQSLSSIQMLLHAAEAHVLPPQARERITLARQSAASALSETRHILEELAPPDLADSDLASALEQVCARAIAQVTFVVDGYPVHLPLSTQAALVRLTQGALSNVDRHAGPRARVVVSLSWGLDTVRLDVVDDGEGFDPSALAVDSNRAFGLATMQARVRELGGEFAVESEAGHTAVSASFPSPPSFNPYSNRTGGAA